MTRDEVIATVQKLLNVTIERGATEGEAANAAAAAARLLLQHDLSMEDIGDEELAGITQDAIPLSTRNPASWQTSIGAGIQKFFGVRLLHEQWPHRRRSSRLIVVGRPTDVLLAKWLFGRLQQDLRRRCLLDLTEVRHWPPNMRRDFRDSWLEGAALAVAERLVAARSKASDSVASTNALVVRNDRAIESFIAREFSDIGAGRRPRVKSKSGVGLLAGAKYGAQVSIDVNAIEQRPEPVRRLERRQSCHASVAET